MRRRNLPALLLALALLMGTAPTAQAAGRTALTWENSTKAGVIYLDLENLDGSAYGIQLELTLDGSYPDCAFTPDNRSAYSPGCTVDVDRRQTSVTIYLTDSEPLNERSDMTLGTLDLGTGETVKDGVILKTAYITVLDRGLSGRQTAISVTGTGREDSGGQDTDRNPSQNDTTQKPVQPSVPGSGQTTPPNQSGSGGTEPEPVLPGQDGVVSSSAIPFTDVRTGDWYHDAVQFVYQEGMMNGTSAATFAPNATTTRGMIVTILHRLEGSPAEVAAAFTDVPAKEYYAMPVAWASANGIVNGYSDKIFQPDTPITREQLAAILYRYAQYKRVDVSRRNGLTQFSDTARISPYAQDAISWAVEAGLIAGMDGRLEPGGSANRAQVATILMRLCKNVLPE